MTRVILLLCISVVVAEAQTLESVRQNIYQILEGKSATVGVAIRGDHPQDTLSVNGHLRLPMQSVYKFHLAVYMMHQIDQGKFTLEDKVVLDQELVAQYSHLWSPLCKQYPEGAEISLAEVITNTVAWSDNLGCDLLFDWAGGPKNVEAYLHRIGIRDIAIVNKEIDMQADWQLQYNNWTTAKATNQILRLFHENKNQLWGAESHNFLMEVLKGTKTGLKDIRAGVPKNTVVAHKTGHSGKNDEGLTGALNNIGIVFLPDGSQFYISILLSNSMEDDETNHQIIASIAKLAWDYFSL